MNASSLNPVQGKRSQAWFRPGRYVPVVRMPVSNICGVEVLAESRRGVQVGRTTIHGTAGELRELAAQILRAAVSIEVASSASRHAPPAGTNQLRAA